MREDDLILSAADELNRLGYPYVQREAPIGGIGPRKVRADMVAWGADQSGTLQPRVLVEFKARADQAARERVLAQLATYAAALGTSRNYLFDGAWWEADSAFRTFKQVDAPSPANTPTDGVTLDEKFVTQYVGSALDSWLSETPTLDWRRHPLSSWQEMARQLKGDEGSQLGRLAGLDRKVCMDPGTIWALLETLQNRFASHRDLQVFGMSKALARAMLLLLRPRESGLFLDPVCGVGSLLWAAGEFAERQQVDLTIRGIDVNPEVVRTARGFIDLATHSRHVRYEVIAGDCLFDLVGQVDYLAAVPPINTKLARPYQASTAEPTVDGDAAFLDRFAQLLKPGGRMVVHTAQGILRRPGYSASLRQALAERNWVVAVIGLPRGLLSGTPIDSALVVLERSDSKRTLVAELQDDWEAQLSENGSFMQAYFEHLRAE